MCLVYTGKKLVSLQVIGSNSPIYEGIFTNTYSFFPSPNFPIMIAPTQHGFRSLSPIAFQARFPVYALKRAHIPAGYQSTLCRSFPTRTIYIICKFSRCLLHPI